MRDLLSDTGSIYVHLDWNVVFYVKPIMDEIFGYSSFLNDIIHSLPSSISGEVAVASTMAPAIDHLKTKSKETK